MKEACRELSFWSMKVRGCVRHHVNFNELASTILPPFHLLGNDDNNDSDHDEKRSAGITESVTEKSRGACVMANEMSASLGRGGVEQRARAVHGLVSTDESTK